MITVMIADVSALPPEKRHTVFLLEPLLAEVSIATMPEILYGPHGKPRFAEGTGLYFNGSHSGDYLACALSDTPVGIDLQKKDPHKPFKALIRRFMATEDLRHFEAVPEAERCDLFYDLWAGKESYIKYLGTGFKTPLKRFYRVPLTQGWGIVDRGLFISGLHLFPGTAPKDFTLWICTNETDLRIISRKIIL